MYYLRSENKSADQLHSNFTPHLRLLFLHMQKVGFLMTQLKLCCIDKNKVETIFTGIVLLNLYYKDNFDITWITAGPKIVIEDSFCYVT